MKKQYEFFLYGFLAAVVLGFIVVFLVVGPERIAVNLIRQSLAEKKNRLEIEDGAHVIVITREVQAPSELSIDCDAIRLTNLSGETDLSFLPPNQEAIINFTVKNEGGSANNVMVHWSKSQLPKGLELTRTQDPIAKLGRSGSQSYKIKVIARNMKAQNIVLDFYPGEVTSKPIPVSMITSAVCKYDLVIAK